MTVYKLRKLYKEKKIKKKRVHKMAGNPNLYPDWRIIELRREM